MSVEGKKNVQESATSSNVNSPEGGELGSMASSSIEGERESDPCKEANVGASKPYKSTEEPRVFRSLIKAMFRLRDRRSSFLPGKLVDDAAFSMLLDLYDTYIDEKQINVSALCANAGAPGTTALRRLDELIELGLAARVPDKTDARRILVIITAKGADLVRSYLQEMHEELAAILDT